MPASFFLFLFWQHLSIDSPILIFPPNPFHLPIPNVSSFEQNSDVDELHRVKIFHFISQYSQEGLRWKDAQYRLAVGIRG